MPKTLAPTTTTTTTPDDHDMTMTVMVMMTVMVTKPPQAPRSAPEPRCPAVDVFVNAGDEATVSGLAFEAEPNTSKCRLAPTISKSPQRELPPPTLC